MKKLIIALLLVAALLCGVITLFSACGGTAPEKTTPPPQSESPAPESAEPVVTPEPTPAAPQKTVVLELPTEGGPLEYSADLNMDGAEEQIVISEEGTEDDPYFLLKVSSSGNETAEAILPVRYLSTAMLADLDGSDEVLELIVSGDMMSDDFMTYCFRYDGTLLETELSGAATGVENGVLTVTDHVNVLGTRSAEMIYTLDENYEFQPAREMWVLGEPDFSEDAVESGVCMTVKKELPVTLTDGTASKLSKGTTLCLIDTDESSIATFRTEDGTQGSIAVTKTDYGFEIDGVSEYEYFELVPYSG